MRSQLRHFWALSLQLGGRDVDVVYEGGNGSRENPTLLVRCYP